MTKPFQASTLNVLADELLSRGLSRMFDFDSLYAFGTNFLRIEFQRRQGGIGQTFL